MSLDFTVDAQRIIDAHHFMITTSGRSYVVRDPNDRKMGRFEGPELLPLLHQAVAAKNGLRVAVSAYEDAPIEHKKLIDAAIGATKPKPKKSFIRETDGSIFRVIFKGQPTSPTFHAKGPAKVYLQQLEDGRNPEYELDDDQSQAFESVDEKKAATAHARNFRSEQDPEPDKLPRGITKPTKIVVKSQSPLEWTTAKVGVLILKHADKSDNDIYAMCQRQGIKTKLLTIKGLRRYFRLCLACQLAIAEEK